MTRQSKMRIMRGVVWRTSPALLTLRNLMLPLIWLRVHAIGSLSDSMTTLTPQARWLHCSISFESRTGAGSLQASRRLTSSERWMSSSMHSS